LEQALLTGIQRVAKESIFSQLNNVKVYTVLKERYASYFGFRAEETDELLRYYDLVLNEDVKKQYDGYLIGGIEIYNPWSVLNYAEQGQLENYWINTSTNGLIYRCLQEADSSFRKQFERLLSEESELVPVKLDTSFIELQSNTALWGLMVNSGYLTIVKDWSGDFMDVRIPNGEVRSEFRRMTLELADISDDRVQLMLDCLVEGEVEEFFEAYQGIVLAYTSYYDATQKENSYHMFFLGMCLSLQGRYEIDSNIEHDVTKERIAARSVPLEYVENRTPYRSDIRMKSRSPQRGHIIIEFKEGENLEKLKDVALDQIEEKQYYTGMTGDILCVGIAHDKKRCEMAYKKIVV
jgi:hypothetical protein